MLNKLYKKITDYGTLVMFSHTIFSLSFSIIAMLAVSKGHLSAMLIFWILLALLSARTGANALNRVIDRNIDKKNPRTENRQIPQGLMKTPEILVFVAFCFALMIFSAYHINTLCLLLSPVALILMIGYSYTKRFTWMCHLILGLTCACGPVGAILAVEGRFTWLAIVMGSANLFWVAGFDIIYGTQDYDFDRENDICSIPARFGIKRALLIARIFHSIALLSLILVGFLVPQFGILYFIGIVICGNLFIYQHKLIKPDNLKMAKIASYQVNQIIGIVFLIFSLADIYLFN